MKSRIIFVVLFFLSLAAVHAQTGEYKGSAFKSRLTDSTTLTFPGTGWGILYYNTQRNEWIGYENNVRFDPFPGLATTTKRGLVPAPGSSTGKFLRDDLTWAASTGGFTNPMTTLGDLIYEDATPTAARLAGNTTTTKKFLTQTGNGSISAVPSWGTLVAGDIPNGYWPLNGGATQTGNVLINNSSGYTANIQTSSGSNAGNMITGPTAVTMKYSSSSGSGSGEGTITTSWDGTQSNINLFITNTTSGFGSLKIFGNTTTDMIISTGSVTGFKGMQYDVDYSANYTSRSLIDKGYAVATFAPIGSYVTSVSGTTNRITSTGGTTPVIDISASYVGQTSITTLGTIATGTWQGTSISTTYTDAKIKTVTGTSNRLTIAGTSIDPTFDISTSYAGQATITTLGTIGTGTWNGSVIGSNFGGAGLVSGLMKANGSGVVSAAVAGTDYLSPSGSGAALTGVWLTGSSFSLGANITINQAGFNQTYSGTGTVFFNPTTGVAGINVGSFATDPTVTNNYDIWGNSTAGALKAKIGGNNSFLLNAITGGIGGTNRLMYVSSTTTGGLTSSDNLRFDGTGILVGGGTITASTRVDIRGIGTGSNNALRIADSGNNSRLIINDNGTITQSPLNGSSTIIGYTFSNNFTPSSGTASYTGFALNHTYNTTGTYAGVGIGIDYNPTLTSVTGLTNIAWRNTSGSFVVGTTALGANTTRFEQWGIGATTGINSVWKDNAGNTRLSLTDGGNISQTQSAATTGTPTGFLFTGGAHTTLSNANAIDINFALGRTVQFGQNTTLALQTAILFDLNGLTYSSSVATKTITKAIGFQVKGSIATGTNASIGNSYPFAITDASDGVEISLNQHNVNFGALIFGSTGRATAPTIGAMSASGGFSSAGTFMRFKSTQTSATSGSFSFGGQGGQNLNGTASIFIDASPSYSESSNGNANHSLYRTGATYTIANGTNTITSYLADPTINITSAAITTVRGFAWTPTLTAITAGSFNYAFVSSSGLHGLGIITPTYQVHVKGTSANQNLFVLQEDGGSNLIEGKESAGVNQLGFFAATPVAQQGATIDLGVALSNLGLRASGTAYTITTSGATDFSGAMNHSGASAPIQLGGSAGTSGQVLTSQGAGLTPIWTTVAGGSGITVGTTTITSGTSTRVGFNDGGVYGEDAGLVFNKTNDILTVGNIGIFSSSTSSVFVGPFTGVVGANPNNSGFGYAVLDALSSGTSNTGLGNTSLGNLDTGSNNTSAGSGSGSLITSGSSNSLYGATAGDNITTGGNNVIIGAAIDAQSATASNQLSIQNAIFGTGNAGSGTSSSSGNIGIGGPPTTDKFEIWHSGTQYFGLTTDGRLYGKALHNNAGSVTGTTNQYLASGTYTPTLFNTTNVAASTAYACQWMRVGNVVTVSGQVDIDATIAASTATELGLSLPIASALTADQQLGGDAISDSVASLSARMKADATNDRASVVFKAISLTNDTYSFTFTYLIQ